jgi:hypothetical protein
MHPRNHRSQSARPRGQNSAPWGEVPAQTLLHPSKSEHDHSVGSKKRTRSDQERYSTATAPCRVSKRIKKKPRRYRYEEAAAEFPGCVDPKNRGKRSVRPRGNTPAAGTSWARSLDGFQNLGMAASKPQSVGSGKMKLSPGVTAASSRHGAGKVEENRGEGIEQGNGAGANCTNEQIGVADSALLDTKDSNHGGDSVAAELKVRNGTCANSVVHTSVPATEASPDPKEGNGSVAEALAKTAIQTSNDFDPLKVRANDAAEFDYKTMSDLDLDNSKVDFDLSSAESALASLYGESDRDMCIEFAVKLLMNETPLPKEAAEIEEFFIQEINGEQRQRQEEPNNSCSVWAKLQRDKLLLTSGC